MCVRVATSLISVDMDGFGCLAFHVRGAVCYVVLCVWLRSVNGMPVSFIHVISFSIKKTALQVSTV